MFFHNPHSVSVGKLLTFQHCASAWAPRQLLNMICRFWFYFEILVCDIFFSFFFSFCLSSFFKTLAFFHHDVRSEMPLGVSALYRTPVLALLLSLLWKKKCPQPPCFPRSHSWWTRILFKIQLSHISERANGCVLHLLRPCLPRLPPWS